eukprot:Sdes_comp15527_c0_seq2m4481
MFSSIFSKTLKYPPKIIQTLTIFRNYAAAKAGKKKAKEPTRLVSNKFKAAKKTKPIAHSIKESKEKAFLIAKAELEANPPPKPKFDVSEEEMERRILIVKDWTRYCLKKHNQEGAFLSQCKKSSLFALQELEVKKKPHIVVVCVLSSCWFLTFLDAFTVFIL